MSDKTADAGPPLAGQRGRRRRGMPGDKPRVFWPNVKRLAQTLRPDRLRVAVVIALGICSVSLTVIGPRLLGEATNIVFAGFLSRNLPAGRSKTELVDSLRAAGESERAEMLARLDITPGAGIDFHGLATMLAIVLALYLVASLFALAQSRLLNRLVQRAMHRLRVAVEAKLGRLPLAYTDRVQRGELLSRVTNDIDNVGQSLQQTLAPVVSALLTVIGVLIMMLTISPLLTVIALVTIPLTALVTKAVAKRCQPLFAAQWQQTGKLNARIEETYSGHAIVKTYGHQQRVKDAFAADNKRVYEASFGAQFISGVIMPATNFFGNLLYVAIAVVGGLRVANGQLTIGAVQAFIQYARQFNQPIGQLGSLANLLQSGVASAERVFELLDETEQPPDPTGAKTLPEFAGRIEFADVSFRYEANTPLIEHFNLVAAPGTTTAIVGATGAGKTTLVNLIMRFYDVDSGRITLGTKASDALDIRDLTRADLRSRIGVVLQDTWLFAGTIADNIRYGAPNATDEQVRAAARAAYVDQFVHSLPAGYDTLCDEDAGNISAGQRQLITIARAFLADPPILILDEATSSVDTRTETLIQKAMAKLRAERTAFVIAHRLSTIRHAEQIVVMANGSIAELGTHDQLLAARGAYYRLYCAQFAGTQPPR